MISVTLELVYDMTFEFNDNGTADQVVVRLIFFFIPDKTKSRSCTALPNELLAQGASVTSWPDDQILPDIWYIPSCLVASRMPHIRKSGMRRKATFCKGGIEVSTCWNEEVMLGQPVNVRLSRLWAIRVAVLQRFGTAVQNARYHGHIGSLVQSSLQQH